MRLSFSKYEGTANDFIVVDEAALEGREISADDARALCDRHLGVGADGVLIVGWAEGRASMRVVNSDGSTPAMCGNGLRCVVAHLHRTSRAASGRVDVDTDAGIHSCIVEPSLSVGVVRIIDVIVSMRVPSLVPSEIPVVADAPMRDALMLVDGRMLNVSCVSMGNPHVVTFDDVAGERAVLGPKLSVDPRFPEGVNVGFARMVESGLELHVFERGAGWTQACGTGACAAAVAAVETGRAPRGEALNVRLPGGNLQITVGAPNEPVRMRGAARFVFSGVVELPEVVPV